MSKHERALYAVRTTIQKRGWLDIPAEGTSMFPLIQATNICRFAFCRAADLKRGDIVLFQTADFKLVAHRFLEAKENGAEMIYLFKGDTNGAPDLPVAGDSVIGKLLWIQKRKTKVYADSFFPFLWSRILLAFPSLSLWIRAFLNKKEDRRGAWQ